MNYYMTVNEVAKLTGISTRTLHYYDEIGLLKPNKNKFTKYRNYSDIDLEILQQILFFRELDFSLKEIKKIINSSSFDKNKALNNHKKLLMLKRERLDKLIGLVENTLIGGSKMSFNEFDYKKIEIHKEKYKKEAEERWGNTDAYKESKVKTSSYGADDWKRIDAESKAIYQKFCENMDNSNDPSSPEVQAIVKQWQNHITKNFYNCTKEILKGLGSMYVDDERFTKNIDSYKPGLAKFMSNAIEAYCKN
jgi:DNA-binding transcriptional MerR regulator